MAGCDGAKSPASMEEEVIWHDFSVNFLTREAAVHMLSILQLLLGSHTLYMHALFSPHFFRKGNTCLFESMLSCFDF